MIFEISFLIFTVQHEISEFKEIPAIKYQNIIKNSDILIFLISNLRISEFERV